VYVRPWQKELAVLALLCGVALASYGFLLGNDLFIYGDHPGQFVRFWYTTQVGQKLLGWNPLWYAGYPELQFYPPGFVMLGWLLDWLTLQQLSPSAVYQCLVFVACLLPGLSIYGLARQISGSRWTGLLCGVLGLIFSGLWGGATAIFVGMVGERLAFGLVPLVTLLGWKALHSSRPIGWWLATSLALAVVMLMHPFHAVGPVLFLGFVALFRPGRLAQLGKLVVASILSLGLIAFWLLPLAFYSNYFAPMLRSTLAQTLEWLIGPTTGAYLGVSLLILPTVLVERSRDFRVFVLAAWLTAITSAVLIVGDHLVLIERYGLYWLDPVRFAAEVYLVLILMAGLGLAHLPRWLARRYWPRGEWVVAGVVAVAILAWLGQPFLSLMRSQRDATPFLSEAREAFPLDSTWDALRAGEGRVLFSSHYMQLGDMPTSLKAATPFFTERPIVGGTFSHWSPLARVLWVGRADVDVLPERVELTDDVSFGGRAWTDWTDAEFFDLCHRLYVTTVATTWSDIRARTFLDAASHFHSDYSDDLFVLYRVVDPEPGLFEAEGATVTLLDEGPTELRFHVREAVADATLQIRITDYPLWQVVAGEQPVAHHADALGLMVLSLPSGTYDLHVRYQPGPAERAGSWFSVGTAALVLVGLALSVRRRSDRSA